MNDGIDPGPSLAVPPLCLERKGLGKAVYTTRIPAAY